MSRVAVDWKTTDIKNYKDFCKKHPTIKLSKEEWKNILYSFSESYRDYVLESGEKVQFPYGFGEFAIVKKKRKKIKVINGKEYINLPIDWKKTKEKGKYIYNFNYETEGYFFGWRWIKYKAMIKQSYLWSFKPSRVSSRLITHYIRTDKSYQDKYQEMLK